MTHCPQCGAPVRPGARACTQCGLVVALVPGFEAASKPSASKTIVGGVGLGPLLAELPPAPPVGGGGDVMNGAARGPSRAVEARAPFDDLGKTIVDPPRFEDPVPPGTLPSAHGASRTLLGVEPPPPAPVAGGPAAGASGGGGGRTLLGVATPGIAPLHPEVAKPPVEPARGATPPGADGPSRGAGDARPEAGRAVPALQELGATAVPAVARRDRHAGAQRVQLPGPGAALRRALRPRGDPGARPSILGRKMRAAWLLGAAVGIVLLGVLTALLWPSGKPLSLRVAARDGVEVLAFECPGCPDGTVLRASGVEATVQGGKAEAPSVTPLPVGDTAVTVAVDRPGDGRDESVTATARVLYRVKLDLATLAGKQPAISVAVEAVPGTRVTVDGAQIDLQAGVGTRAVDVSSELTGGAVETTTLTRKIPYTVEPPDAPAESGVLTAQVAVVPLRIDAPGPTIITDRTTFVLAGRTAPGAELTAAGHPIAVKGDGTFAHVMSVSSTGQTTIEVRASQPGKAPRIGAVAVERVATLEEASRRFREQKPLAHGDIVGDPGAARGKPVVVSGEIMDVRRAAYQTIAVVNVTDGCKASCLVRVVIGSDADLKQGSRATFYGQVAGAFAAPSGPPLPEIDAAFYEVKGR